MSEKAVPKMLRDLPEDKLQEVKADLQRGIGPGKLARAIQKDWGLLPKTNTSSLTTCLQRYRKDVTTEIEMLENMHLKQVAQAAVARIDEHINALDGYQELIQIQMGRVRMAHEEEKETKVLYKQTGFDIDVANRLLTGYVNTAVKAGVISHMVPEPEKMPSVNAHEMADTVLHRPQLKEGLMAVIGSVLQDVQDLPDDISST